MRRCELLFPPLLLSCGLAALFFLAGTRWTDPLVDFGQELYISWRVLEGGLLYHEIPYLHGPLSPYLNAVWFLLFGTSAFSLLLGNLLIAIGITLLSFSLMRMWLEPRESLLAVLLGLGLFGLSALTNGGNYNFFSPYTHQVTHGLFLSLIGIQALYRNTNWSYLLAGVCLSFLLLGKLEFILALGGTAVLALTLSSNKPAKALALCAGAGLILIPLLFTPYSPADLFNAFQLLFEPEIRNIPYHVAIRGFDKPLANFFAAALSALCWLGALQLDRKLGVLPLRTHCLFTGAALLLGLFLFEELLQYGVQGMPLLLAGLLIRELWRARTPSSTALLLCFSLLLTTKVLLNLNVFHYGFVLGFPGLLALSPYLFRTARPLVSSAILIALVSFTMLGTAMQLESRDTETTIGDETFLLNESDAERLDLIASRAEKVPSHFVFPENGLVHFALRTKSPGDHLSLLPNELIRHGEEQVLNDFYKDPPEEIYLSSIAFPEYRIADARKDIFSGFWDFLEECYQALPDSGALLSIHKLDRDRCQQEQLEE